MWATKDKRKIQTPGDSKYWNFIEDILFTSKTIDVNYWISSSLKQYVFSQINFDKLLIQVVPVFFWIRQI